MKVIEGTMEELVAAAEREDQEQFERRVKRAKELGNGEPLVNYQETVMFGKPYAWVSWGRQRLRLLRLTEDGIVGV